MTCLKCGVTLTPANSSPSQRAPKRGYCRTCQKARGAKYYEENRDKVNNKAKGYRTANKEKISVRGKTYRKAHLGEVLTRSAKYRAANREKVRQSGRESRFRIKAGLLTAYGGKCVCCGESAPLFLTIDHKNGDGAKERKEKNLKGGVHFYEKLRAWGYPQEHYQLLCYNCNCARQINRGVCPHQEAGELWVSPV